VEMPSLSDISKHKSTVAISAQVTLDNENPFIVVNDQ